MKKKRIKKIKQVIKKIEEEIHQINERLNPKEVPLICNSGDPFMDLLAGCG